MKKIYILLALVIFINADIIAAPYYWVGGTSGNWQSSSNWSSTSGGAGGAGIPAAADDVTFDAGGIVTVAYDATSASLFFKTFQVINNTQLVLQLSIFSNKSFGINNAGTFEIVAAGSSMTLRSSTDKVFEFATQIGKCVFNGDVSCETVAANVNNGPTLNSTADSIVINALVYSGDNGVSIPSVASTFLLGSKFRVSANAVYQLDRRSGNIPSARYVSGSLIRITGVKDASPVFSGVGTPLNVGGFEWNCPNQTIDIDLDLPLASIFKNNFTVINTGTKTLKTAVQTQMTVTGNLIVNGGTLVLASDFMAMASIINVSGNLIQTGAILNIQKNSSTTFLNLKGSLNQTGGVITKSGGSTTCLLNFNSTSTAPVNISLTPAGITNDVSVKIATGTAGIVVLTDIFLPNSPNAKLNLTSGNLDMITNNRLLFIQNPASSALTTGSPASHIIGDLKRSTNQAGGTYSFPVSDNATYMWRAILTASTASSTDFLVSFKRNNPNALQGLTPGTIDIVAEYYWDIERSTVGTPTDALVSLFYNNANSPTQIVTETNARIVHWNGTTWDNLGGIGAGGSIDAVTVSSAFSPFTIAGPTVVLPISINYIQGNKQANNNSLDWKVSYTTSGNILMNLQRSSDGRNFVTINNTVAADIRCNSPFNFIDNAALVDLNYYRLQVIEQNGKNTYSNIIGLTSKTNGFDIVSVTPNPIDNFSETKLNIASGKAGKITLKIIDFNGKTLFSQLAILIAGSNSIKLNLDNLAAGMYQIIAISSDGASKGISIVK